MLLYTHRHGNLITRELAVGLCPFLSLVVRFGRSATQIPQNASLVSLTVLLALPLVVRFGGFGVLSGQNGPPEGEQGAQPSRPSWRGPFWRIWAAQRQKQSTRERQGQRPMRLEEQGRSVLTDLGC